jgi:hypothetical protein
MLMSLSSTNSTVCPAGRSLLTAKSKARAGTLRSGRSDERSSSLEAPPVSLIIRSGLVAVSFGVNGSLIRFFDSSTAAGRILAANLTTASGDWG